MCMTKTPETQTRNYLQSTAPSNRTVVVKRAANQNLTTTNESTHAVTIKHLPRDLQSCSGRQALTCAALCRFGTGLTKSETPLDSKSANGWTLCGTKSNTSRRSHTRSALGKQPSTSSTACKSNPARAPWWGSCTEAPPEAA